MAAKKKSYKKMTNAEKKLRKEVRESLREEGLIPPVKAKLNRKKFLAETKEEFKSFESFSDLSHLYEAISIMTTVLPQGKVSPEQVGVAKVLKLAMEIKKYHEGLVSKGETTYKPYDRYKEVIEPIMNL
ncbi:addiction module toxin RelE [Salmonella enterica subsp. enterica]|nr:addiction module toxin RelE [Salmonella enterica subsp. enterica serovar Paratyphi A]